VIGIIGRHVPFLGCDNRGGSIERAKNDSRRVKFALSQRAEIGAEFAARSGAVCRVVL
jgi:hypothetical protein